MSNPFAPDHPLESGLFINNEFVDATSGETITVINPATGLPAGQVQVASAADVDKAVAAAQAAFPAWSARPAKERAQLLRTLSALILKHKEEFIGLEVVAVGKARGPAGYEVERAAEHVETAATQAEGLFGETSLNQPGFVNLTIRQPYGVVAGIIPWNVCLLMAVWKVAPSVAAGNCLILKTSEKSPFSPLALARLSKEAGFPPGVINVLSGAGAVGAKIAEHPLIRKLAFTGSTATGKKVQEAAARSNLKVVTLELGGKSATVVFADADLPKAVEAVALSNLVNMGQACTANTRVFVEESLAPAFLEQLKGHYAVWASKQGDPTNPENLIGTVADAAQLAVVKGFIEAGKTEGTVAAGGVVSGNFVRPTIFTNVSDDARINTQEIFGPVLVFHTFKDEAEALRRANASEYALYASVFTRDIDRALRVARALEAGGVSINTSSPTLHFDAPFGGWKTSGYGRELGPHWVASWTQTKTIYIKVSE